MRTVSFVVNETRRTVTPSGTESLLEILRDSLDLTGTKGACEQGECGSCSVVLDDVLVCSCLVMAADCDGAEITTVEGLGEGLNMVQDAMLAAGAVQCGFCTPGFVVAATHFLANNSKVTESEMREALAGNLCRCTGYGAIVRSLTSLLNGT